MIKKTLTVQELAEAIDALELEEQEMLMEMFNKRLKEYRRKELLKAFENARQTYAKGEVTVVSVAELLAELRNSK
ncbi:MAG: hypothetical protein EAZ76_08910 [Nostocales cyanobacterium]|nr:MAG: hypothetical protein EAZ87_11510 [Nostocales cyanobacterium]TAF15137.1 MAG: hypothetical protein EAZ76_08910 [Nostocales cyanobacterium]